MTSTRLLLLADGQHYWLLGPNTDPGNGHDGNRRNNDILGTVAIEQISYFFRIRQYVNVFITFFLGFLSSFDCFLMLRIDARVSVYGLSFFLGFRSTDLFLSDINTYGSRIAFVE